MIFFFLPYKLCSRPKDVNDDSFERCNVIKRLWLRFGSHYDYYY